MHYPALCQSDSMQFSEIGAFDRSNPKLQEAMDGGE